MDRKQVLIPEEQTLRQRDFERKIRELHAQRGKSVRALVDTFGCQQNVADSQHIMGMLEAMGCTFVTAPEEADIVVLNTCAIRDHAEKRVYGTLGALTHTKKANPEQIICLCGCMAQRPEVAEKVRQSYRHVDLVFGPQALWKFPELLYQVYTRRGRVFSVEDEHGSIAEGMPVVREGRTRAWVSIMYGCNNFCSYCIVPYVRGRERSREPERILEEVRQLAAEGYKEITLLGQNVNSYGKDLGTGYDFADLLTDLDKSTTYHIREQQTLENYRLDNTDYTMTVAADGRIDGLSTAALSITNRMLRVSIHAVDMVLRSDTADEQLSLYNAQDQLIQTWTTNGSGEMFTDLTEGSYYVVRGEPNAENAKKYNFTVQDTARQQNWNVPVFTLRSAIALAVLAVIAAGVIWLLVFLWGVLARRKARKAAEAQKEEKNEEDSNKKES